MTNIQARKTDYPTKFSNNFPFILENTVASFIQYELTL
jgi:hypothetical protein